MPNRPLCKYQSPQGEKCTEIDMGTGYCFWHDAKFDKCGLDLTEKLERYAQKGGLLKGLQLKRANLSGLSLVCKGGENLYDVSYSDFYRANLKGAHFYNLTMKHGSLMKADLRESNLNCACFHHTNLLGTKLQGARVDNIDIGDALLQEVEAYEHKKKGDQVAALDFFEQSEEIYRDLRKAAEYQGLFELAGGFTYKELSMRRYQYPRWSSKRIISRFMDLLCGYGEKPLNVIAFSLTLILCCACLYFTFGVSYNDELLRFSTEQTFGQNLNALLNSLYFSVVTFTTLGYGDITPIGVSRLVAACEAFCGSFSLALFVVVFVKKMTR